MTISLKLNKISTHKRRSIDVDYYNLDNPPLLGLEDEAVTLCFKCKVKYFPV